jgi:Trypsin-like peptidase domain
VGVAPFSEGGVSIERFGRLPLISVSGKGVGGEWVSIVQHPNGQPKQIAIRASQIIHLDPASVPGVNLDHFIYYSTDTDPGSSGSPVFNDQWQVLALHHKAVPAPVKPGAERAKKVRWIANEGVRISAIFGHLSRRRFEDDNANLVLNRLSGALGFPPLVEPVAGAAVSITEQYAPFKLGRWKDPDLGYDSDFLSQSISLDDICAPARSENLTAPLLDQQGDELTYKHFSVVLHKERRFALITAVNIDGGKLIHPGTRKDTWRQEEQKGRESLLQPRPSGTLARSLLG